MNKLKLPPDPEHIIQTLKNKGFDIYAVGGCVRDLITGRSTHDWDFTTNAIPEDILLAFPNISFYNNNFGTVGVVMEINGKRETYEITTYRSEQGYSDRRRPDRVIWGESLTEDLARRDFSINAIAFDGTEIQDPYDGQKDLVNKIVRAVGEPEKRFEEDALRLIRAIRIATQLDFSIEKRTGEAMQKQAALIEAVSKERIRDELMQILASNHPAEGIMRLKTYGLLHYILPELDASFNTPQKSPKRHHVYDVGTHSVESLRNCRSEKTIVRFAALLHDIGKPPTFEITHEGVTTFYNHEIIGASIARAIALRLRLSRSDTGVLITLVRWHQFSVNEDQTDSAIRRFIRHVGLDLLPDILEIRRADRLGSGSTETSWRLEAFKKRLIEVQKEPFSLKDLKINGNDIMKKCNIGPGLAIGKMLNQLFDGVVEKRVPNEKEALLEKIQCP